MLKLFVKFLDVIPLLILVIYALTSGKVAWKRDYIFYFIIIQMFLNATATILDQFFDLSNLYLYHVNCAASFLILSLYFLTILYLKNIKKFIWSILFGFLLFFVFNLLEWEGINSFNSNTYSTASFIIVAYCFLYYLQSLIYPATINILKSKDFYYVTGLLTYYASSFIIFVIYRKFTQNNIANVGILWLVHNVVFLLMCVYILIGFLCKPSPETYKL